MTTTIPAAHDTHRVAGNATVRGLWESAYTFVSVAVFGPVLVFVWTLAVILRPFFAVARRLPLQALGRAWPPIAAIVLPVAIAVLSQQVHWADLTEGDPAQLGWLVVYAGLFAVLVKQVWAYLIVDFATFDDIRAHNARAWPERWYAARMRKPIDAVFVRMIIDNTLIVVPAAVILLVPGYLNVLTGLVFLLSGARVIIQEETIDHTDTHNRIFRRSHLSSRFDRAVLRLTDLYHAYVLAPLSGRIPNWYDARHRAIHHAEDNGLDDIETTARSDRTSFVDYCRQCMRAGVTFVFPVELVLYLRGHGKRRTVGRLLWGMFFWYAILAILALYSWPLALFVWCMRFRDAFSDEQQSYAWHGLADPDEPDNVFRCTSDLYSDPANDHGFFGASFHLHHHRFPSQHWSTYAERDRAARPTYVEQGAIRFKWGEGSLDRCAAMWRRDYGYLAENVVAFEGDTRSQEELTTVIADRLAPARGHYRHRPAWSVRIDRRMGRVGAMLVTSARDADWERI